MVTGLGLATTACASTAPSAGVTRIDQAVVVAYKPCPDDRAAIGSISLFGSDDPDTPVWRATLQPDGIAVTDLPVRARYPGYDIVDRRVDEQLDPSQRYSFEATATDDTEWGGPGFAADDLRQGEVRVAGQILEFRDWVDSPTSCPRFTSVDAASTALVVAGVVSLLLVGLRLVTRRFRRGATDPTDPLRA